MLLQLDFFGKYRYNKYIKKFLGGIFLKIVGLCGGSGSGKGTVAKLFSEYGIPSVDTDAVYHEITSKFGHDGFLLENDQLTEIIQPLLP